MAEDVVVMLSEIEREAHRRVAERMAAAQVGEAFVGMEQSNEAILRSTQAPAGAHAVDQQG